MSKESVKPAEILTEEKLYAIENSYGLYTPALAKRYHDVVDIIVSHRLLLSANAELSFSNKLLRSENQKLKDDYNTLLSIMDRARQLAHLTEVEPK